MKKKLKSSKVEKLKSSINRSTFQPSNLSAAFAAALITFCSASANALPLVWRADWPGSKPVETLVHRGTDIEFQPQWYINGELANSTNWTFQTFVQTNAQATGEWFGPLPGAAFSHTNDVGAAFYNVMVRAQMPGGGINYTAFARLRMLDSPGYTPGALPLPMSTIDFSKVVAVNAPWLLPDATNGLVEAANDYTDAATNRLLSSACAYTDAATNRLLSSARAYTDSATNALLGVLQEEITPLQIQAYYPDGSVTSAAELTADVKYTFDTTTRTAMVKPFCNTGDPVNDNSSLEGRVVIPPFVDSQGNPYIADDGTRYKVVGVAGNISVMDQSTLTAIVAPTTVTNIGDSAFENCESLASVSLPAAKSIGNSAFGNCWSLASVSLPVATSVGDYAFSSCYSLTSASLPIAKSIGEGAFVDGESLASVSLPVATSIGYIAFSGCISLASVSFPAATSIGDEAFGYCTSLTNVSLSAATTIGDDAFRSCHSLSSVDFGDTPRPSVPSLGSDAFSEVPTTCKIIVPDSQYDAWIAASGWEDLYDDGYKFLKHSEWEYARRYELDAKLAAAAAASTNYTDEAISSISASSVGAYPAASGEQLATQVAAIGANLNGEDARLVATNYDSAVTLPAASVELKMRDEATGSNTWITIWQEMRRWTAFVGDAFDWRTWGGFYAWATNVMTELAHKADRAWGAYDSETGGYSPEGFTQVSSSNILIASGMAYQRTVTSAGSVWVLQCNQGVAQVGGDTNGFFRVLDGDGAVQFEIIKGDRQEMGCDATGITVGSGNPPVVTIPYSIVADEHPTLRICDDLATHDWKDETDPDCIATVSWAGASGAYVATVQRKTAGDSLFVKATYMAGAETYIRNAAPVGMDSIILNGVKYYLGTATIDGKTVLTLSTTAL